MLHEAYQKQQYYNMNFHITFVENLLKKELGFLLYTPSSLLIVPLDAHTTRRISLMRISRFY